MEKREQALRNDPAVRMEMVNLVEDVGHVLQDAVDSIVERKRMTDAFAMDVLADDLVGLLVEFLTNTVWAGPSREEFVSAKQLTAQHAASRFRIRLDEDGVMETEEPKCEIERVLQYMRIVPNEIYPSQSEAGVWQIEVDGSAKKLAGRLKGHWRFRDVEAVQDYLGDAPYAIIRFRFQGGA